MYATIRHRQGALASTDELARAGRALAVRLAAAPGFVACLLLETPGGGHAAVCICEDPASLAAADGLVAGWAPTEFAGDGAAPGSASAARSAPRRACDPARTARGAGHRSGPGR